MKATQSIRLGDLESYLQVAKATTLRASPAGRFLAVRHLCLSNDGRRYQPGITLFAVADGQQRRLALDLEVAPEFEFASETELIARARPCASEPWGVWLIDVSGNSTSSRLVADFPGDVSDVVVGRGGRIVAKVKLLSTQSLEHAAEISARRERSGTHGILHESFPVRSWDRDLGPHRSVLVGLDGWPSQVAPQLLTPGVGRELDGHWFDVSPDGSLTATGWHISEPGGARRSAIVLVDSDGQRRFVADERDVHFEKPRFSPDGRHLLCERIAMPTMMEPPDHSLWVIDVETGAARAVAPSLDLWPVGPRWATDSAAIYFVAEERGRRPVFCADLNADETVSRLTDDDACFAELAVTADDKLFALRSGVAEPPTVVSVDPGGLDGTSTSWSSKAQRLDVPGTLLDVSAKAQDGQSLRGWLALPAGASAHSPAPLILLIHGGPEQNWGDWAPWGYNPWIFVERGFAVLMPDPALSTGYGQAFIRRGWTGWGNTPYTDLISFTDTVCARADIDQTRIAAVGHSFGGYMANWIAGHTTRFRAIVSHAGLWALPCYGRTTDRPGHWERQFGNPDDPSSRYVENSPERFKDEIRTPMLLVHGDLDYRVPVSESIHLWRDLTSRGIPGRFLYFPDENHYILRPGNIRAWYEAMLGFLDEHLNGSIPSRPQGF